VSLQKACELLTRLGVETATLSYDGDDYTGSLYDLRLDPDPPAGISDGLAGVLLSAAYWLLPQSGVHVCPTRIRSRTAPACWGRSEPGRAQT